MSDEPTRDEKRLAALCALSHRANCVLPKRGDVIKHRCETSAMYHGSWQWTSVVEYVEDTKFFLVDGFVGYKTTWDILWTFDDEMKQNIN